MIFPCAWKVSSFPNFMNLIFPLLQKFASYTKMVSYFTSLFLCLKLNQTNRDKPKNKTRDDDNFLYPSQPPSLSLSLSLSTQPLEQYGVQTVLLQKLDKRREKTYHNTHKHKCISLSSKTSYKTQEIKSPILIHGLSN